ncbi:MAG: WD40 repeat domain-containing protein [Nitrospirota bacterium]
MKKIVLLLSLFFFLSISSAFSASVNYEKVKTLVGYTGEVLSIAFSPDGKTMVIGTSEKKLVIYNVATWQITTTVEENNSRVTALAFSRDGKLLASGDRKKRVCIFDTTTWKVSQKFKAYDDVEALAFNPDGSLLAAAGGGKEKAMLWDVKNDELSKTLTSRYGDVRTIAFSPDGTQVAGGTSNNKVVLWETASGSELKVMEGHSRSVQTITYSPDGKYLVSGGGDNAIMIWDAKTGKVLNPIVGAHSDTICALSFIPNTTIFVAGECKIFLGPFFTPSYVAGDGCKVIFWDAETAKPLKTIKTNCSLSSAAVSPDGKYFVTGNATGPGQYVTVYEKK